ncbi:REST [Branchiostoma lanceolatum]|uniref:REST protein n=1 Tax=Branchiostoma lanceolatum TaxID=7740 RepID=A0A8K0EF74_BRALA|nr:REST [Branchiostoma lanceolatum]
MEARHAQSVAKNSLPGTCARMPADIHVEQGNVSKSNVPHTSFPLLPQTLQATIIQDNVAHGNTSPYMVGQANLMLEPTEARTKKPDHQSMQEMLSANNSNSFQSAATSAEREKYALTNNRQTDVHTQASVETQQMLPTLNQQSAPENSGKTSSDSVTQQSQEQDCTQSLQDNESSVQEPCETENSNNPPGNVVVKIEPEDDYWTVPSTTSSTNNDNDRVSGIPSLPVVKTEEDDSVETSSILPLDYSARSLVEEETIMVETEDNSDSEELREERVDHASPERSQVMTATPVQQEMPRSLLMIHTEQHDSTSAATPLTGGTTLTSSQDLEDGHFSHVGFLSPDFSSYVSTFRDTRKQNSQKRKTVRALLEDLKKAKQLKSDGLTDQDDPMGIVSAMKDWRKGRRPPQSSRRDDEGSFVPPGGEVLAQRSGNVQVQGQEGPSPQFHLASTESDMRLRALRGVVHRCMFCPFETRLKTNLQCHLRDHAEINVYRCAMCSFSAAAKQTLDDHVATQHHEELPFMCGVCGYRTGVKENLSTHMWVVHKAGQSFQCSLCEYSTSYKTRLETHMINHHF